MKNWNTISEYNFFLIIASISTSVCTLYKLYVMIFVLAFLFLLVKITTQNFSARLKTSIFRLSKKQMSSERFYKVMLKKMPSFPQNAEKCKN